MQNESRPPNDDKSPAGASHSHFEKFLARNVPAHGVYRRLNRSTVVFLTICTRDRRPYLACDPIHELLIKVWTDADKWLVGRYVIMPDHIHLFASPASREFSFDSWVRFWKSQFTRQVKLVEHRWQTDHWDRTLRDGESYQEKWNYVRENPVRLGLASVADDWPYQGELNYLPW
ncbi:MAG TPA: hypothetical protein VIM11_12620 [Tepidisphaeraceae bacterium]|jgi:putative transposase